MRDNDPRVYHRYREENLDCCECAFETGAEWKRDGTLMFWPAGSVSIPAVDAHHIWSLGRRPHLVSNLIALAAIPHRLVHHGRQGNPAQVVRLICTLAKVRKRERLGDPAEFDLDEADFCAGRSILGWAESFESDDERIVDLAAELAERLQGIAANPR